MRARPRTPAYAPALLFLVSIIPASAAFEAAGSDWPCAQRKVDTLTSTQLWDGPPVEGLSGWEEDARIAELLPVLVSRGVPMEKASAAIEEFSGNVSGEERDAKLTLLFAGIVSRTNSDRATVLTGIESYQKRQRLRAAELEREGITIGRLADRAKTDSAAAGQLEKARELYNWNARVFQERQNNLPLACEIPVLIEQRAFELGRAIRSHMKG